MLRGCISELNLFDLETSKPKVRVKRDALPEEPLIVNSEGQDPIAPAIPDEFQNQSRILILIMMMF